jgi:cysteinyl-tRNA synthetase
MSHELLDPGGSGFDIHGGGADLIFPHHENEVAQSEPLMPHPPMANFWMHGGLLLFDNQKMSKSLGNFEPLYALLDRHDAQAIRLLFLQTGYRKVMNFTEESIAAASVALERLKKTYRALGNGAADDLGTRMEAALNDDMNTAVALSELLSYRGESREEFAYWLDMLGLTPSEAWLEEPQRVLPGDFLDRLRERGMAANGASPEEAVEQIIAARTQARKEKNWAESDRLRDLLAECGVALKDSKEGTTWTVGA